MSVGRPSHYTPEIWAKIIESTEEGNHLRGICRELGIGKSTVYDWMTEQPTLKAEYEVARREGYDVIAQDCLAIADDLTEEPASRRVRVETRLKLLAKWYSQQYGDKVALTGGGPDDAPIKTETKLDLSGLTEDQLRALASIRVPD